jgi:hypothetical protein
MSAKTTKSKKKSAKKSGKTDKPIDTVLGLLPNLERPDLALVESKLGELLNSNGTSRRVKRIMKFSFALGDKEYNLEGSANNCAMQTAEILFPQLRNQRFSPPRVFTGRVSCNFWKKSEFAKVIKAVQDAGGMVISLPEGVS